MFNGWSMAQRRSYNLTCTLARKINQRTAACLPPVPRETASAVPVICGMALNKSSVACRCVLPHGDRCTGRLQACCRRLAAPSASSIALAPESTIPFAHDAVSCALSVQLRRGRLRSGRAGSYSAGLAFSGRWAFPFSPPRRIRVFRGPCMGRASLWTGCSEVRLL